MAEQGSGSTRREFLRWLSRAGVGLAAGGVVSAAGAAPAAAQHHGEVTVLLGATVIDGTGTPPRPDQAIVLAGDRIAWVGHRTQVPAGVRTVDLRGKFVIPGLWEMHSHTGFDNDRIYLPLYLVNGVTGVREMWGSAEHRALRDRIASGAVAGPRMVLASNIIDGPGSFLGAFPIAVVRTEAEAREQVRQAKREGADFVKVYSYLTKDLLAAIADESARQGLPFAGHLSEHVSAAAASDAGQRSFEHLFGALIATSTREAEFRQQIAATPVDPANPYAWFAFVRELERQAALSYDPRRADKLFARLARNRTWQSPTLINLKVGSSPADTFLGDPRLKYLPRGTEREWQLGLEGATPSTPEQIAQQRALFQAELRLIGAMDRAGVGILTGTDNNQPYVFPGFSVHDELALLVEAGLTPMRALQAATRDAANAVGLERSLGTVTPGKAADLVVLDADPLHDIRNTQRIHAVVTRGRVISAAERQRMLADIEAAAGAASLRAAVG